jgi:hypothetical protein
MKKAVKTLYTLLLATACLLPVSLQAQPGAALPSEEAWQEIQNNYESASQLPSERAAGDLRATRPTDEVPIGGLDAPLPDCSWTMLIVFALSATLLVNRRKNREKNQ